MGCIWVEYLLVFGGIHQRCFVEKFCESKNCCGAFPWVLFGREKGIRVCVKKKKENKMGREFDKEKMRCKKIDSSNG